MTIPARPVQASTTSEVEAAMEAYLEAARGDIDQALLWALADLIRTEAHLSELTKAVSHGYIRCALGPRPPAPEGA